MAHGQTVCIKSSFVTTGQPDGAIKIHKVNIVPNPPKQGAAIAVTAKATLSTLILISEKIS